MAGCTTLDYALGSNFNRLMSPVMKRCAVCEAKAVGKGHTEIFDYYIPVWTKNQKREHRSEYPGSTFTICQRRIVGRVDGGDWRTWT